MSMNEISSARQVFTEAEGCLLLVLGAGSGIPDDTVYPLPGMGGPGHSKVCVKQQRLRATCWKE